MQQIVIHIHGNGSLDGSIWFAWTIRGLTSDLTPIAGCDALTLSDPHLVKYAREYAAYTALGKALAYLVAHHKGQIKADNPIVICSDGTPAGEATKDALQVLRDAVGEKAQALGCKVKPEWIPAEQNIEAVFLARAAYVGAMNRPVPVREKK